MNDSDPSGDQLSLENLLYSHTHCFKALSHLGRLRMFMLVASSPVALHVQKIAETLGMTEPGASKGLKELCSCGLLTTTPVGQFRAHLANSEKIAEIASVFEKLSASLSSKGV